MVWAVGWKAWRARRYMGAGGGLDRGGMEDVGLAAPPK